MNRFISRRARIAVIGMLLVGAFGAADARAQGYAVEFNCERSDGWSSAATNENFAAWRDCAGGWLAGMKTYVVPHNDGRTSTGSSYHAFTAPADTRVTGIDWEGNKFYGFTSAGYFGGGWAFKTAMLGDNFREIDGNAYCYTDNYGACFSGDGISGNARSVSSQVRNLNERSVGFYTACTPAPNNCPTNSDGQPGHNYTRAGLVLNHGRVYLRDDRDPVIRSIGGSVT